MTVDGTLPPGRYRFELVVVDDEGRRSRPAQVVVAVGARDVPPAPTPPRPRATRPRRRNTQGARP